MARRMCMEACMSCERTALWRTGNADKIPRQASIATASIDGSSALRAQWLQMQPSVRYRPNFPRTATAYATRHCSPHSACLRHLVSLQTLPVTRIESRQKQAE
ncbi:hypothetical protein BD311DRAFT_365725 [Dichomitus squalens]|uniref:Uncharacterized protein n=1 Tax=Dichomitus squalens TaxID=114155 RepID=A0A4Q9MNY6_9APHY|nr:hypothetical protein BD311DRAFT_365725 [Dichomitus squalens]